MKKIHIPQWKSDNAITALEAIVLLRRVWSEGQKLRKGSLDTEGEYVV